jgi:hypothetical protein
MSVQRSFRAVEPPNWFSFLKLEVELAHTFIESAKLYVNPVSSANALAHARKALSEIQKRLSDPAANGLGEDEIKFLGERCAGIESALKEFRRSHT